MVCKLLNNPNIIPQVSKTFYFKYFDVLRGTKNYELADEISTKYLQDTLNTEEFKSKLKITHYINILIN